MQCSVQEENILIFLGKWGLIFLVHVFVYETLSISHRAKKEANTACLLLVWRLQAACLWSKEVTWSLIVRTVLRLGRTLRTAVMQCTYIYSPDTRWETSANHHRTEQSELFIGNSRLTLWFDFVQGGIEFILGSQSSKQTPRSTMTSSGKWNVCLPCFCRWSVQCRESSSYPSPRSLHQVEIHTASLNVAEMAVMRPPGPQSSHVPSSMIS